MSASPLDGLWNFFRNIKSNLYKAKTSYTVADVAGDSVDVTTNSNEIRKKDLLVKEDLENALETGNVSLLKKATKINLESISKIVDVPGRGGYSFGLSYIHPVLEIGKSNVFYGRKEVEIYEEIFRKARENAIKYPEQTEDIYADAFRKFLTHLNVAVPKSANSRELAKNSVVIIASKKALPGKKIGESKLVIPQKEYAIQVHLPDRATSEFDRPKRISEFKLKEYTATEEGKIIQALKQMTDSKKDKKVIIVYQDSDENGKNAVNAAKGIGLKNAYPIINYEQVAKEKEKLAKEPPMFSRRTLRTTGKLFGALAAAGAIWYASSWFNTRNYTPETPKKQTFTAETKTAEEPAENSKPKVTIGIEYKKNNDNIYIVNGTDSDGISKLEVYLEKDPKANKRRMELLFDEKYDGEEKEVRLQRNAELGDRKPGKYRIRAIATDTLGNTNDTGDDLYIRGKNRK
ncbi:hypothetical protein JXB27_02885 [Candidatus Woesearchaeota archaeon]|nr:hypothetical protein [Candidatus Woesearchaeota archaeon]